MLESLVMQHHVDIPNNQVYTIIMLRQILGTDAHMYSIGNPYQICESVSPRPNFQREDSESSYL